MLHRPLTVRLLSLLTGLVLSLEVGDVLDARLGGGLERTTDVASEHDADYRYLLNALQHGLLHAVVVGRRPG